MGSLKAAEESAIDDPNKKTLDAYNKGIKEYIERTPQTHQLYRRAMMEWIDKALELTPKGGRILEIGSATPRDALYMRSKGYAVQCSDGAWGFVQYLNDHGEDAIRLDILTDRIEGHYDMIFANAVFPHFTNKQFEKSIISIRESIRPGAIFAFSVKRGVGEEWVNEKIGEKRYINYWVPSELDVLLKKCGFSVSFTSEDAPGDLPSHHWILIIAKKL